MLFSLISFAQGWNNFSAWRPISLYQPHLEYLVLQGSFGVLCNDKAGVKNMLIQKTGRIISLTEDFANTNIYLSHFVSNSLCFFMKQQIRSEIGGVRKAPMKTGRQWRMKGSSMKGAANHHSPESCLDGQHMTRGRLGLIRDFPISFFPSCFYKISRQINTCAHRRLISVGQHPFYQLFCQHGIYIDLINSIHMTTSIPITPLKPTCNG
jgi:hypothetical protein